MHTRTTTQQSVAQEWLELNFSSQDANSGSTADSQSTGRRNRERVETLQKLKRVSLAAESARRPVSLQTCSWWSELQMQFQAWLQSGRRPNREHQQKMIISTVAVSLFALACATSHRDPGSAAVMEAKSLAPSNDQVNAPVVAENQESYEAMPQKPIVVVEHLNAAPASQAQIQELLKRDLEQMNQNQAPGSGAGVIAVPGGTLPVASSTSPAGAIAYGGPDASVIAVPGGTLPVASSTSPAGAIAYGGPDASVIAVPGGTLPVASSTSPAGAIAYGRPDASVIAVPGGTLPVAPSTSPAGAYGTSSTAASTTNHAPVAAAPLSPDASASPMPLAATSIQADERASAANNKSILKSDDEGRAIVRTYRW